MAKSEIVYKEVFVEKIITTKEKKRDGIILTLTDDEAFLLYRILSNVGGNPSGPRGVTDKIYQSLIDTNVMCGNYGDVKINGYILF